MSGCRGQDAGDRARTRVDGGPGVTGRWIPGVSYMGHEWANGVAVIGTLMGRGTRGGRAGVAEEVGRAGEGSGGGRRSGAGSIVLHYLINSYHVCCSDTDGLAE